MFHECQHILPSGDRCHAAALRNQPYCYFHNKLHRVSSPSAKTKAIPLPPIEDDRTLKLALAQILRALDSPHIDIRRARLMLYGLQIAAQVTARSSHPTPAQTVRSVSTERDGSEPAPRQIACEPPGDRPDCPQKDECMNMDRAASTKGALQALSMQPKRTGQLGTPRSQESFESRPDKSPKRYRADAAGMGVPSHIAGPNQSNAPVEAMGSVPVTAACQTNFPTQVAK